jgi:hypothetical protein
MRVFVDAHGARGNLVLQQFLEMKCGRRRRGRHAPDVGDLFLYLGAPVQQFVFEIAKQTDQDD